MSNVNGSKWIRPERRLAIYIRDSFSCAYCQADLRNANPRMVTLDHLTPRSANGGNESTNLVTCCLNCNSSRQDSDWRTYACQYDMLAPDRVEHLVHQPLNLDLAKAILEERSSAVEEVR